MPEIGATLREARLRHRADIADFETETKIRAKYLRALENEEWDLLPGPTFVKTFLRTYAEALGLDGKLLVEEYKLRHERLADAELRPISPRTAQANRGGRRGSRRGGGSSSDSHARRDVLIAVLIVVVLGIVFVVGRNGNDDGDDAGRSVTRPTTSTPRSAAGTPISPGTARTKRPKAKPKPVSKVVRLQLIPTGEVNVCLKAAGGKTLVGGATLSPADARRTYRSTRFVMTLGNNAVRLKVDGETLGVPASSEPIGYVITRKGRRTLPASQLPECPA